jgi:hypothetical protein
MSNLTPDLAEFLALVERVKDAILTYAALRPALFRVRKSMLMGWRVMFERDPKRGRPDILAKKSVHVGT